MRYFTLSLSANPLLIHKHSSNNKKNIRNCRNNIWNPFEYAQLFVSHRFKRSKWNCFSLVIVPLFDSIPTHTHTQTAREEKRLVCILVRYIFSFCYLRVTDQTQRTSSVHALIYLKYFHFRLRSFDGGEISVSWVLAACRNYLHLHTATIWPNILMIIMHEKIFYSQHAFKIIIHVIFIYHPYPHISKKVI